MNEITGHGGVGKECCWLWFEVAGKELLEKSRLVLIPEKWGGWCSDMEEKATSILHGRGRGGQHYLKGKQQSSSWGAMCVRVELPCAITFRKRTLERKPGPERTWMSGKELGDFL